MFAFVSAVVASFFMGRLSAPPSIKTVERVVTQSAQVAVAAKQEEAARATNTQKRRVIERIRYVYPDGTRVERLREGDSLASRTASASGLSEAAGGAQSAHQERVETKSQALPAWRVGALVGLDIHALQPTYGAHVERRLVGPLSLGGFALTSGVAGLSLSLEF